MLYTYLIETLQQSCEVGAIILILQMRNPRHKEIKQFAQGHIMNEWLRQDLIQLRC